MGDIIMIKKYIKGHELRGTEVIKALEELGGLNKLNLNGKDYNCLYYIREDSVIDILHKSLFVGKMMQECFEEIKLPEQPKFNVVIKEPKQIYWFRATKDDTKNQALFDKLYSFIGINKCDMRVDDGIVCFNPLKNSTMFYPNQYVTSSIECTIAMMIGKELVIE